MRKDGSTYPSLIYTSPIVRDGIAVGLRGVGIDITERKRAEEEVRRANQARYRQLREIAGGVSRAINPTAECRFLARCPFAVERCKTDPHPELYDRGNGHMVSCHLVASDGSWTGSERAVLELRS